MKEKIKRKHMLGIVLIALAAIFMLGWFVFSIASGTTNEASMTVQDNLASVTTSAAEKGMADGIVRGGVPTAQPQEPNAQVQEQKLIKTGSISVEVRDVAEQYPKVESLAKQYEGYIFNMRERTYDSGTNMTLIIKVKADNFEKLFDELKKIGVVENSSVDTEDVTRQFIDITARLDTLKLQETTLKGIMAKATKVEDLLRVETELQRIRQEIESSQGQLNYLSNSVDYSVINFDMRTKDAPSTVSKNETIWERFLFSFKDGLGFWGNAVLGLISAILWLLPVIVVGVLLFRPLKKLWSKIIAKLDELDDEEDKK